MIDYKQGIKLSYTSASDRDQFFHWRNHPSIWYWCRQNGPITYAQHTAYWYSVDNCTDKRFFSVISAESNLGTTESTIKTVGCAGLTSIDHINSTAEFSLYIGPEYQKRGYGKIALKALIDWGFKYLNLNCIWGETFDQNPALRMFLNIGMTKDGTRRSFYYRNGSYIDCHLVSILREEWNISQ